MAEEELEVREEDAGQRLDVFLVRRVPELSRARAKALIEAGRVHVDGRTRPKSHLVSAGDRVALDAVPESADFYAARDGEASLEVLFECEDYVIVDKPAGMPSHPLRTGELGTLAGALVARYPEMREVGYHKREPGIVHRLDTGTSGVMLAARTTEAFEHLRSQLRAGAIEKRYLARCRGVISAPRIIDAPIANDPRDRRRVRVCDDPREVVRLGAKPAITEVLASTSAPLGSLVELRVNHARRHQIRAHLAWAGHPLLGDTLYGGPRLREPGHHLLHASSIRIEGHTTHATAWNYSNCELVMTGDGD